MGLRRERAFSSSLRHRRMRSSKGRGYVTPDDVKQVALDVLRHRIITTFEARAQEVMPEQIIQRILDSLDIP